MDENLIKRVPPHSEEAEKSVIGAMILDPEAIMVATEVLTADDFYEKKLGIFFEEMVNLQKERSAVDLVTIQSRLLKRDIPEEYTSIEYISKLVEEVPTSANIKYYANIVREKSLSRQFIKAAEESVNSCYLNKDEMQTIFAESEKKLFKIFQTATSVGEMEGIDKIVLKCINNIEIAAKNDGTVTGIPTGFIDLDYMTAGMQPSDLVLVAARPSMGKTAFVLNMAEYMAVKNNFTTCIFSLEMSKTQLVNRMISMHSRVNAQAIRTGKLSDTEWADVIESSRIIGESHLIIDDTPSISIGELRSKVRKMKLENDLKCVIIDYIQLMTSGSKRVESRQNEVAEISRNLKAIAREINCPIIALSQLSRLVEQRPDKRPMLSDLRESGAIEQDADVVMFIYRDEYYNKDSETPGQAEIIIGKQRNGPVGTVNLKWIAENTKFANLQKNT